MTPWEFSACVAGYNKAHGEDKPEPPTEEEFEEALHVSRHILETLH